MRKSNDTESIPDAPVMELRDIRSAYGDVTALRGISLEVYPGEVHALIGEHGAGKSTLGSVMSGLVKPRSGTILIDGKAQQNFSLRSAKRMGIRMVYQQHQVIDSVSVTDNIFYVKDDLRRDVWFSRRKAEQDVRQFLEGKDFSSINPKTLGRHLSPSDKTVMDILKSIVTTPRVLILDEALERLSNDSLIKVGKIMKRLKQEGTAIVIVTHRIDDVYSLADRVTVLKEGVKLFPARRSCPS